MGVEVIVCCIFTSVPDLDLRCRGEEVVIFVVINGGKIAGDEVVDGNLAIGVRYAFELNANHGELVRAYILTRIADNVAGDDAIGMDCPQERSDRQNQT